MKKSPAGQTRAMDLQESVRTLWPGYLPSRDRAARGEEYLLLPLADRPLVMVPRKPRRSTGAALRHYKASGDRRTQLALRTLGAAARLGLFELLPIRLTLVPPDSDAASAGASIRSHLRALLGDDSLVVALRTSSPRANRKPVLQVVSADGRTIAFAKVGTNPLTKALVAAEASALERVGAVGLRRVVAPALLHHGSWQGHEVLVQSPFLDASDESMSPSDLAAAMVELATIDPPAAHDMEEASYVGRLRDRISMLPSTPSAAVLSRCLSTLEESGALDDQIRLGHWHGDWTPWNMSARDGRALVWDWERFEGGVPLGFDALHYDVQGAIVRQGRSPREAVADMLARCPSLLRPFDVDPDDAALYAALYLVEIGTRYLQDRQEEAGSARGRLETWLLPELEAKVRRLAVGAR